MVPRCIECGKPLDSEEVELLGHICELCTENYTGEEDSTERFYYDEQDGEGDFP